LIDAARPKSTGFSTGTTQLFSSMGKVVRVICHYSGKTFTMGLLDMIDTESDGLIPLSIRYMFDNLKSMRNYFICVSMVQVYKEDAFDLLNSKKGPATIREDPVSKIFFIPGLVIVPVEDENQATDLVNVGLQLRTMAPQSLKLTFADLAGNENVGKSDSKGLRLEEAKSINSSLCSLSDAICRLKNNNDTYLFRSSKLTKILQCSLMGHSYICILGMVRRSANFISETLSTLKFVIKCRQIKMSDPPQCMYSDIQDDLHVYLSHNQKSVEKSQRKVNKSEQDIPEHEFPSEEFREFTNFLGKCLISLSRMVKKIIQEVMPRQEAFIPHHITDESYIDGQEDNCLEEGIY
jgi:kinesin family member 5